MAPSADVSAAALAQDSVGSAAKVVQVVKGKRGVHVRLLMANDEVFLNERIETGPGAAAEIVLVDNTRLSLGPRSVLVIDEVILDPSGNRTEVVVSVLRGVFRFVSGDSPSWAYRIKTPVATMGVEGTVFSLFVDHDGTTMLSVNEGAVNLANLAGASLLVGAGLSSTVAPPGEGGGLRPPTRPVRIPDAVAVVVDHMEKMLNRPAMAVAAVKGGEDFLTTGDSARAGLTGPEGKEAAEGVPERVLLGALTGSSYGVAALTAYLHGDDAPPEIVARRAMAVVHALEETAGGEDVQTLVDAVRHVADAVSSIFQTGRIMRLTVDAGYLPPGRAIAWDLGPPDGRVAPGFEAMLPRDGQLAGAELRGMSRPGGDPLTSDGILGVESISVEVPNGQWRVIIMTEDLGEGRASLTPFGEQFLVNGEEVLLRNAPPEQWGETTYLTNETWDRDAFASGATPVENVASDTAGVMVNETRVSDNLMTVQFVLPPASRHETYLTGIILEPVTVESSVKGYPDTAELLGLEGLVATTIVGVLEEYYKYVQPSRGQRAKTAPAFVAPVADVSAPELTEDSVGFAAQVVQVVKGKRGLKGRRGIHVRFLAANDEVFPNERIETGPGGAAEIVLVDNTRLSLGPRSALVIDKVILDPSGNRRAEVVVSVLRGVFRFVSGDSPSWAYRIKTPVATIAVHGTIFDLTVDAVTGATTVTLRGGGALAITNLQGVTQLINTPGSTSTVSGPDATPTALTSSAEEPTGGLLALRGLSDALIGTVLELLQSGEVSPD
ncbi:MAG: FecR domain-containing protein [Proteobacteria bacterium]|nr:FecR domain-containing protein [Pseudomonadota bacterium]